MKRIKILLAVMLVLILSATVVFAGENAKVNSEQITGDINLDGEVDMNDAILLLQHSMFPQLYPLDYVGSVDYTEDGEVDMNDAILLLQHSMFPHLYPLETKKLFKVTFYDLGLSTEPIVDPIYVYEGDSAVYPDYELWYELGYEKSYDTEFFDDYVEESLFDYDYAHRLDYEWYYMDENGEFVRYDDSYVFEKDLDVYAKIKRLDVEIKVPESIANVDEVLIFNIPYTDDTRYVDLERDGLFFNYGQIETKLQETGIEEKMNDEYLEMGVGSFENGSGILNEEYEISKTDVTLYLYDMMGGMETYKEWLWEQVEAEVLDALGTENAWRDNYDSLISDGLDIEQALCDLFENKTFGEPPVEAQRKYTDSAKFIKMSTQEDEFPVTADNLYIAESVAEKLSSLVTFEDFAEQVAKSRIPDGLIERLPMDVLEGMYSERAELYFAQFDDAVMAVKGGDTECYVPCGVHFDINLATELLIPLMEYLTNTYADSVNSVSDSSCRIAELVEAYHSDNPYATSLIDGYMLPELFIEDTDGDGLYTVKSIIDRYRYVFMPLKVETTDALLWFTDVVDFADIESIVTNSENKEIGLHFVNRTNALVEEYSNNGLPEDVIEYYNDLLEDEVIRDAVEKLDNGEEFDMMFFVETNLKYQLAEMLYMKILNRLGVPADVLLGSSEKTQYTEEDYDNYVERLGKIWADTYTADEGLDEMFGEADENGEVKLSIDGIEVTVKRYVANSMFE